VKQSKWHQNVRKLIVDDEISRIQAYNHMILVSLHIEEYIIVVKMQALRMNDWEYTVYNRPMFQMPNVSNALKF
jgi:hypothetical protein